MKPERDPVVVFAVACILIGAAVITYAILMSRSAAPVPATPAPGYPAGVTIGTRTPSPTPSGPGPVWIIDRGDGNGPQEVRGAQKFGEDAKP